MADPFAGYVNANKMIEAANHPTLKQLSDWLNDDKGCYSMRNTYYIGAGLIQFELSFFQESDSEETLLIGDCWISPFVARILALELGEKFFSWFTEEITRLADAGDARWSWIYDEHKLGWGLDLPIIHK